MSVALLFVLLLSASSITLALSPTRVPGSPFPAGSVPTDIWLLDWTGLASNAQRVAAGTLAGAVARSGSQQVFLHDGSAATDLWLLRLVNNHHVIAHSDFQHDFIGLLRRFADSLSGFVLAEEESTANGTRSAVTAAAALGAVVLAPSVASLVSGTGLSQLVDARGMTAEQSWQRYSSVLSNTVLVHQKDIVKLGDYAVFAHSFAFYDNALETSVASAALAKLGVASAVLGWTEDEYKMVERASRNRVFVNAADHALNLALFTNIENTAIRLPKVRTSTHMTEKVHRVAFVMSDGDNVQWMLNEFSTSQQWFASPRRGSVPIGWTISPALLELAPHVVEYLSNASTANDDWVAGPSGLGYTFPDFFPAADLPHFAQVNAAFMERLGLRSMLLLGNDFSLAACKTLLGSSKGVEGAFWMNYRNYAELNGAVHFAGNTPIVGPRWILAHGMGPQGVTPSELAKHVNSSPTDPSSASAYTLVVVHVWSMTVDDVVTTVSLLNATHVKVVSPTEFLRAISKNIHH